MGIFSKLFGKQNKPQNVQQNIQHESTETLLQEVEVSPGVAIPKVLVPYWPVLAQTKKSFLSIVTSPAEELSLSQSKICHYPFIPNGFSYPTDSNGNFMIPLLQINFSECPRLNNFPSTGYLQIYIADNDIYGLNFVNQQEQVDFRILYFKDEELANPCEDFSFLERAMTPENSPVYESLRLSFQVKDEFIGIGDFFGDEVLDPIMSEIVDKYPDVEDELFQILYDRFMGKGHKMEGYAYFTPTDPRKYRKDWDEYILLLQIDSDERIMWGDVGVANFFIHPDDLAKLDFSKVIYNWDCS